MKTLFIDRKDTWLECRDGRLLVHRAKGGKPASVPLAMIERLVICAPIQFSTSIMASVTAANIVTVFLNARNPESATVLGGRLHNDATRRLQQYALLQDPAITLSLSRALVHHKIRLQAVILGKILRQRPDCRYALTRARRSLADLSSLAGVATSIDSLRGIEGSAAAQYFAGFRSAFAPSLGFESRNRRPPRDPVNAVLSLTYTLLYAEATKVLLATGFDPALGVYHAPEHGRASLACDFLEVFRPAADLWVWSLFATGVLRPEDFGTQAHGGISCTLLKKAGRERYYKDFATSVDGWRRMMRRAAADWLLRMNQCQPG